MIDVDKLASLIAANTIAKDDGNWVDVYMLTDQLADYLEAEAANAGCPECAHTPEHHAGKACDFMLHGHTPCDCPVSHRNTFNREAWIAKARGD